MAAACSTHAAPIDYYWLDANGQLVIQVTSGDMTTTKAVEVDETEKAVTIAVWLETGPLPMANIGRPLNLNVDLQSPLGDREVLDGNSGARISLCTDVAWCTERGGAPRGAR